MNDRHGSNDVVQDGNHEDDLEDDYVVKSMGALGKWQVILCVVVGLNKTIAMWNVLAILFLTSRTEYRCVKFKSNVTMDAVNSTCYKECVEYEYYQDVFEKTLISEFGLICEYAWMASFTQTVFMLGLMVGISISGWMSDRFGRKNAMIVSCSINVIFMFGAAYAPNYWTFTGLRFVVGAASAGTLSIATVYMLETVGPQYRELAGGVSLSPIGFAECTLSGFAYFAPTWNIYLLSISVTSMIILMTLLFIPETPRWLVSNGKGERAVRVMTRAAKFNSRSISNIRDNVSKKLLELNLTENNCHNMNYTDLFKTKKLTMITLSSLSIWFVTGLCYYGLNQYTAVLSSNVFIVVAIMGGIQIPLALFTSVITKIIGRRTSAMGTYIICGISMLCLIFLPPTAWTSTIFALIGTSSVFLNLGVLYIYTAELYPTTMRNMGFCISAATAKLGAMVSPFIANLGPQFTVSIIFAVLSLTAAAICCFLPETKGKKLQDTLEEDIMLQRI